METKNSTPTRMTYATRSLSSYETVLDLLNQHGDGIFCHVMVVRCRFPLTLQILRRAFRKLVHYQPSLKTHVETEIGARGLTKRFVERKNVNEFNVTELPEAVAQWEPLVEREFSSLLDTPESLWKVLLAEVVKVRKTATTPSISSTASPGSTEGGSDSTQDRSYAIVFRTSHVMSDHVSLHEMLVQQLVPLLESIDDKTSAVRSRLAVPLFLKPSVDQCFLPAGRTAAASSQLSRKKSTKLARARSVKNSSGDTIKPEVLPVPSTDYWGQTKLITCVLTSSAVIRLLRLCETHSVSLPDVLAVASAYSYRHAAQAHRIQTEGSGVKVCRWFDMRGLRIAPLDGDPLGMWLCPIIAKCKVSKKLPDSKRFWADVKKYVKSSAQEAEPWQKTFAAYVKILENVNKDLDPSRQIAAPAIPNAHVSLTFVDTTSSSHVTAQASRRVSVEGYHVMSSVSPCSISRLVVCAVRRPTDEIYCSLSRNGHETSRDFSEMFMRTWCRLLMDMTHTKTSTISKKDVKRLPPVVRARVMKSKSTKL